MLKDRGLGFALRSLALLVIGLAFYAPAIDNYWIKDDLSIATLMDGEAMSWSAYRRELLPFDMEGEHYWRPIPLLPGYAEHALFGLDVRAYHVTNILLQVGSAIALMALFAQLVGPGHQGAALMTALLFLLAPTGPESVVWIMQRMVLMVSLFSLLGMIATVKAVQRESLGWRLMALIALVLALLSKEVALTLPGLYFLIDLSAAPPTVTLVQRLKRGFIWALPAALVLGLYFLCRYLFWGRLVNSYAGLEVMDYARVNRVFENLPTTLLNGLLPANPGILGTTPALILRTLMAATLGLAVLRLPLLWRQVIAARKVALLGLSLVILSWLPILPIVWIDERLFNARFFHGPSLGLAVIMGTAFFLQRSAEPRWIDRWALVAGRIFVGAYALSLSAQLVAFDRASDQILGIRDGLVREQSEWQSLGATDPHFVCLYVPDQYQGVPTLEYSVVQLLRPPLTTPSVRVLPLLARDFQQAGFWLADLRRQIESLGWQDERLNYLSFSNASNDVRPVFPERKAAQGESPARPLAPADLSFRGNAGPEPEFVFASSAPAAQRFQIEFRTAGLDLVFGPYLEPGVNCEDLGAGQFRYRPSQLDPSQPDLPDLWARTIRVPFDHPIPLTWRIKSFAADGRLLATSLEQRLLIFNEL